MNLVDLSFFVECHVHDYVAAENSTGILNRGPIATAVTTCNTGTHVMYSVVAK